MSTEPRSVPPTGGGPRHTDVSFEPRDIVASEADGPRTVQVSPDTVALSLALCIGVALLLSWRDVPRWWPRPRFAYAPGTAASGGSWPRE